MKKNLRKIPQHVHAKLRQIKGDAIVVGCAVTFKADALSSGKLKHLGISLTPHGIQLPPTVVPPRHQGKYSRYNVDGVEIIRKDLPKETHYNSIETPNWGDSYKGTHTVDLPYEKYPREFQPPRELEIILSCENAQPSAPAYIIAFQVGETLDRASKDFKKRLLEDLNLLQESIGACGVESANVPLSDYKKSLHVSWEILPPGTVEEAITRLWSGKTPTVQEKEVSTERHKFFTGLKPKGLIYGTSGFRRYFGALLEDNLVLFENLQYGNAIYILFEDWKELSRRSRLDLLSRKFGADFERVIHKPGWKGDVRTIVEKRRSAKNGNATHSGDTNEHH